MPLWGFVHTPAHLLSQALHPSAQRHHRRRSHQVVYREGRSAVRHYCASAVPKACFPPLFIVSPLINSYAILDLSEERSVALRLARKGVDVYLFDWGRPDAGDQRLTLDRIDRRLARALAAARSHAGGGAPPALMGYCIGGTVATIRAACDPDSVSSLTLLATPIDFEEGGVLALWAQQDHLPLDAMLEAYGNIPGELLWSAFDGMHPGNQVAKLDLVLRKSRDREFLNWFSQLEAWVNDPVDVPGGFYRSLIQDLYRRNALLRGELEVHGTTVDLQRMSAPLLVLTASADEIVPEECSLAILDHVASAKKQHLRLPGGHIGCSSGPRSDSQSTSTSM
ncbi:alpha/beta fold hydrolase, partial [Planctomycetota bacterium]